MLRGRLRTLAEEGVANLTQKHPNGFPVAWLRSYMISNGVRSYPPSTTKLGHFLCANAEDLGLVRVADGRWAPENGKRRVRKRL